MALLCSVVWAREGYRDLLTLSVCPGLNLQSRRSDGMQKLMPLEEERITVPKRRG